MNILEFIEQEKDIDQLDVEYKGQCIEFHIKNLSQAEIEKRHGSNSHLLKINNKRENGGTLTDKEAKDLFGFQSKTSYELLCKSDGSPLYETYEMFVTKIKGNFLKAINEKVEEHTKLEEEEDEKN